MSKFSFNYERDIQSASMFSAVMSIILSTLAIGLSMLPPSGPIERFVLVVAGYHLGVAVRSRFCELWHSVESLNALSERSIRNVMTVIDAERIASGKKSIHEIQED